MREREREGMHVSNSTQIDQWDVSDNMAKVVPVAATTTMPEGGWEWEDPPV